MSGNIEKGAIVTYDAANCASWEILSGNLPNSCSAGSTGMSSSAGLGTCVDDMDATDKDD